MSDIERESYCVKVETKDGCRSWHYCDEIWKAVEEARHQCDRDNVKHVTVTLNFK